jgi:hypothetical protein
VSTTGHIWNRSVLERAKHFSFNSPIDSRWFAGIGMLAPSMYDGAAVAVDCTNILLQNHSQPLVKNMRHMHTSGLLQAFLA